MGNSQKPKPKEPMRVQPPKQEEKVIECEKCKKKFLLSHSEQVSLTNIQFQNHLEECLDAGEEQLDYDIDEEQDDLEVEVPLPGFMYQKNNPTSNQNDEMYLKIPANAEKTEFVWEKVQIPHNLIDSLRLVTQEVIVKRPFKEKIIWFRYQLEKLRISWQYGSDWMKIQKDNVIMTSIEAVQKVNMYKQVKIDFIKEKVNDAGGLLREWMHLATKEIFSLETGIFQLANTTDPMFKIRWDKQLDEQFAQSLFLLFGTILGKAVFQRIPLTCYLDYTILRQLTGNPIQLRDIQYYDKQLYKHWKYLIQTPIEPFGQYFCLYKQHGDKSIQKIELLTDGQNIEVVEQNKKQFVDLSIKQYCVKSVERYMKAICKSFHKIIPLKLISIFDTYELEMIIFGLPYINLNDWIANTQYKGAYYVHHPIIKWFWQTVRQFSQQQLGKLLHFCTGSTRIPIYGFKKLQSNRGNYAKFLIESTNFNKINPYPKGHTCFNRLELPMYSSSKQLKLYLKAIVTNNMDGIYGLD